MVYCFNKINGELIETKDHNNAVWVNLYPPFEHGELDSIAADLNVPLDFITDALDIDERSRYEKDEDVSVILISSPLLNEDTKNNEAIYLTLPIGIIVTPDKIITVLEPIAENKNHPYQDSANRIVNAVKNK